MLIGCSRSHRIRAMGLHGCILRSLILQGVFGFSQTFALPAFSIGPLEEPTRKYRVTEERVNRPSNLRAVHSFASHNGAILNMKNWPQAMRDSFPSGSVASIVSAIALSACGKSERGKPLAPINVISRWLWGDRAARHDELSFTYTLPGYAIHHASSTLWAAVYEKLFGDKAEKGDAAQALTGGVAVAALACFVDYQLTPYRLQPGFEKHLSAKSMALVYGSFGLALALRGLASRSSAGNGQIQSSLSNSSTVTGLEKK